MKRLIAVFCALTSTLQSQLRFEAGELKGFTRSPTEHILERLEDGITVRRIEGRVGSKEKDQPLEGVLIELRGPGEAQVFRSTVTDRNGRFSFQRVSDGDYKIKLTLNGFRSVVGMVTVRSSAKESKPLRVEMLVGV